MLSQADFSPGRSLIVKEQTAEISAKSTHKAAGERPKIFLKSRKPIYTLLQARRNQAKGSGGRGGVERQRRRIKRANTFLRELALIVAFTEESPAGSPPVNCNLLSRTGGEKKRGGRSERAEQETRKKGEKNANANGGGEKKGRETRGSEEGKAREGRMERVGNE